MVLLAACAAPRASGPIALAGDAGDTVRLAAPATRVASLQPTTTELLFAIGAGELVVGRTTWCDAPDAALAVPSLGDGLNPNLEAIVAARPDLVLLYPSALNDAAAARLGELGIATLRLRTDRLSDVPRLARLLGHATGRHAAGDSVAARFERDLAAATATRSDGPSVFILAWDQPLTTIGAGSFLSEVVQRAGGRNVFAELASASAPVSLEAVTARDPSLVLVPSAGLRDTVIRPEWNAVRAFRERRLIHVTGSEYLRPTPRAPDAVRALAARLAAPR
ncbi:MAG TPA: helical backbone metal receptor [Gemmatimonadales bacterium]|nr:helical backbone metal receptor [Gemmatimonadales bacterium]